MTSLNGEYVLLGRKTDDTSNIFIQFGQGATRTFNTTAGSRGVEGEWIDGFRMSVQTQQDSLINVDVKQPFTPVLEAGFTPIGNLNNCPTKCCSSLELHYQLDNCPFTNQCQP
jgi:hypothetical protein